MGVNRAKPIKKEIRHIIKKIKKKEITVKEVPEEYQHDPDLIAFERQMKLRIVGYRGYDVIRGCFFVEETLIEDEEGDCEKTEFSDFSSYYEYLCGDVYTDACYTYYHFSDEIVAQYKLDVNKLYEKKSLTVERATDFTYMPSDDEITKYKAAKQVYRNCIRWVEKFNACNDIEGFRKVAANYIRSTLSVEHHVDLGFFVSIYIFSHIEDKERLQIALDYLSDDYSLFRKMRKPLCSVCSPEEIMAIVSQKYGKGAITDIKEYIECLAEGRIVEQKRAYFDSNTHFICEETTRSINGSRLHENTIKRWFASFEEFVVYRNGDLRNCDLSRNIEMKDDLTGYITDETTKKPLRAYVNPKLVQEKGYKNGAFYVIQQWLSADGSQIKKKRNTFQYFFDFAAFLQGDLSGSDLLHCDGLERLTDFGHINWKGAKLKSSVCHHLGIPIIPYHADSSLLFDFENVKKNETASADGLLASRELPSVIGNREVNEWDILLERNCRRVYYISDLHLLHRLQHANCESVEDVECEIENIVDTITTETKGSLLLINGDVASDYCLFQSFVQKLSERVDREKTVVFTLGNHELWPFEDQPLNQTVSEYRNYLRQNRMILLHNDILCFYDDGICCIQNEEIATSTDQQLSELMRKARLVILGGLGFSGLNEQFNANNGIYRHALNRAEEIMESEKMAELYNRLLPILNSTQTIVMTHTPVDDWCMNPVYRENLIYVSGHNHRNSFSDDGEHRIYADNQIGYSKITPHMKNFLLDNTYDLFGDYPDGIHEITRQDYIDFCHGKNMGITYNRNPEVLYMLKKRGYYCFISKAKNGNLCILNGGALKSLDRWDIRYYYDHMDKLIQIIEEPLGKYYGIQKSIAELVKKFGGEGTIHGCIIDIDFFNHIYVHPSSLVITGYWAQDIIRKKVYPSVPALLEERRPDLFKKYCLISGTIENNPFAVVVRDDASNAITQVYLETDIYKASREMKKMQKINNQVLSVWYDELLTNQQHEIKYLE